MLSRTPSADGSPSWEARAGSRQQRVGSERIEEMVVDHLVSTFLDAEGIDLSSDHLALQRLHEAIPIVISGGRSRRPLVGSHSVTRAVMIIVIIITGSSRRPP